MQARLTIFFVDRPATRFHLRPESRYTLGRDADCEIHLADHRVSRQHARFEFTSDGWRCDDLSSKNGIRVNGVCAGPHELRDGAWLDLGGVFARFELVPDATASRDAELTQRRRDISAEFACRLDATDSLQQLLDHVLDAVLELSGTQRGFVMLANGNGDFDMTASRRLGRHSLVNADFSGSLRAVRKAVETAQPVVLCDAAAANSFAAQPSVVAGGIRALLCLPLQIRNDTGGVVYADSAQPGTVFDELDLEILAEFAARAAVAIAASTVRKDINAIEGMLRVAENNLKHANPGTAIVQGFNVAPLTLGELLREHAVE